MQQNRRFGTPDPPGCHIPRRPPNTTWGFASAFFGKRGRSSSRCAKPTILLHIDKRNRAEADARCRRSAPKPPDHCHGALLRPRKLNRRRRDKERLQRLIRPPFRHPERKRVGRAACHPDGAPQERSRRIPRGRNRRRIAQRERQR